MKEAEASGAPLPPDLESRVTELGLEAATARSELEALCRAFPEHAAQLRQQAAILGKLPADSASVTARLNVDGAADEAADAGPVEKYEIGELIGRGGIGIVYAGRDRDLRREVALKFLRDELRDRPEYVRRFIAEARVSGQLQHPGIVPMYEIGSSDDGVFLAMKLVRGQTLAERLAARDSPDDDQPRLLAILELVCQAVGYCHARGVVHRDLKPSNVLIGEFGEVQVIDWGLAKRPSLEHTEQVAASDAEAGAPLDLADLHSVAGSVVGTPAYMAPEQARGDRDALSPRSDVFSLGAILFEIVTGETLFGDERPKPGDPDLEARTRRVIDEAAGRLGGSRGPASLARLCRECIAYEPGDRPADAGEVARLIREHLDGLEERARRAELEVASARHKQRSLAVIVTILLAAGALSLALLWRAEASEAEAQKALSEFRLLSDVVRLREALALEERLHPAWPSQADALESWIREYGTPLAERLPTLESSLAGLRALATRVGDSHRFDRGDQQFLHDTLAGLVADLQAFVAAPRGALPRVVARWQWASSVHERSVGRRAAAWREAIEAVRAADGERASALYGAMDRALTPQVGLVPLGMNPHSKFWEFYHLRSAADPDVLPARGADGYFEIAPESGIVFVLLPGGEHWVGSQRDDPSGPNYDPFRSDRDAPVQRVTLEPFLIAAHEVTQAQWMRLTGEDNPSMHRPGRDDHPARTWSAVPFTLTHPVEMINCFEALLFADRQGFAVPHPHQWEYACRAGTSTPWNTGADVGSLHGSANVLDEAATRAGITFDASAEFDDGFSLHGPVGALRPNGFGLFDTHGNIFEWNVDERGPDEGSMASGGAFHYGPMAARSSSREPAVPGIRTSVAGVRVIRMLTD